MDTDYIASSTDMTSVADAIRTKAGLSVTLEFPSDFITAIANIPTGITPTGTISITQNGAVDVTNYATADVNVSGGGKATNVVSGTFTAGSGGAVQTISIPYSGAGFPIVFVLTVLGGKTGNADCAATVHNKGIVSFIAIPANATTAPNAFASYFVAADKKNSTTSAKTYAADATTNSTFYTTLNPTSSWGRCVVLNNSTTLKVYVATSGNAGLIPGLEYQYYVIYST